jgi:hypothetical protein
MNNTQFKDYQTEQKFVAGYAPAFATLLLVKNYEFFGKESSG